MMIYKLFKILFCGAIISMFGYWLATSLYFHHASKSWVEIPAVVNGFEKVDKGLKLKYSFNINGTEYNGDKLAFLTSGSLPDMNYIEDNYEIGQNITVYVNPTNPNQSVAIRREFSFAYIGVHLFVITFCTIFALSNRL